METFSALLAICAGNSPVPGEFHTQRPVTRSFDVYFDLRPNKRLSKQSWGWWFETLSCSLWRHRNGHYLLALYYNKLRILVAVLYVRVSACQYNSGHGGDYKFGSDYIFWLALGFIFMNRWHGYKHSRVCYLLHGISSVKIWKTFDVWSKIILFSAYCVDFTTNWYSDYRYYTLRTLSKPSL